MNIVSSKTFFDITYEGCPLFIDYVQSFNFIAKTASDNHLLFLCLFFQTMPSVSMPCRIFLLQKDILSNKYLVGSWGMSFKSFSPNFRKFKKKLFSNSFVQRAPDLCIECILKSRDGILCMHCNNQSPSLLPQCLI